MKNKNDINKIIISTTSIVIEFKDGIIGEETFAEYPRLNNATTEERTDYRLSYFGIHWPKLDEDLSFEGFYKKAKILIPNSF
ncbi:MAG: DUF2442 domain-containing protein [Muribaculaceae bacterium]|nr:DUF2442 domain-containing protein [Muribaculaceae bacterium]